MPFVKFEACLLFRSSIKKKRRSLKRNRVIIHREAQRGTPRYRFAIRRILNDLLLNIRGEFVKYSRGRKKLPFTLVLPFTCKWAFVKKFNSKARAKVEASPFETKLTDISPPLSRSFLNRISYFKNFPSP